MDRVLHRFQSAEAGADLSLRLWGVGLLAVIFSAQGWIAPLLINKFNANLFHGRGYDDFGGWAYVLSRIPISVLLLWVIASLPMAPASMRRPARPKARVFDPLMGLRAFACFLVVMGHYFMVCVPFSDAGTAPLTQALLRSCPWAGVWIFFTLSGYLMGKGFAKSRYSLDEIGCRAFWRNRFLRIMPIYAGAVILISILEWRQIFVPRHLWMLLDILMFDHRGDLPLDPIGALWSVTTEFQFYLLVPFLALLLIRIWTKSDRLFALFPLVLLGACTLLRFWIAVRHPGRMLFFGYTALIPNLGNFVAGMSINWIPGARNTLRRFSKLFLVASPFVFYFGACIATRELAHLHLSIEEFWAIGPIACVLYAGAFIWMAELIGEIRAVGFSGRCLSAIQGVGVLTYCIYVFHSDIFLVVGARISDHSIWTVLLYFPPTIAVVVVVAAFFYFVVEKPFDLKKRVRGSALLDAP